MDVLIQSFSATTRSLGISPLVMSNQRHFQAKNIPDIVHFGVKHAHGVTSDGKLIPNNNPFWYSPTRRVFIMVSLLSLILAVWGSSEKSATQMSTFAQQLNGPIPEKIPIPDSSVRLPIGISVDPGNNDPTQGALRDPHTYYLYITSNTHEFQISSYDMDETTHRLKQGFQWTIDPANGYLVKGYRNQNAVQSVIAITDPQDQVLIIGRNAQTTQLTVIDMDDSTRTPKQIPKTELKLKIPNSDLNQLPEQDSAS